MASRHARLTPSTKGSTKKNFLSKIVLSLPCFPEFVAVSVHWCLHAMNTPSKVMPAPSALFLLFHQSQAWHGRAATPRSGSGAVAGTSAPELRSLDFSRRSSARASTSISRSRSGGEQYHRLELRRRQHAEAAREERNSRIKLLRWCHPAHASLMGARYMHLSCACLPGNADNNNKQLPAAGCFQAKNL